MKKTELTGRLECAKCGARQKGFLCSTSDEISDKVSKVKVDSFYKTGEFIFKAGDHPLGLFSVRSGVVKVEVLNENGQSHTVRLVGPGGLLGYKSLFLNAEYKKSAIALEDAHVCFIPKQEVLEMFKCHPELGLKMIGQLGLDLERAETKWADQIDKGALSRVGDALLFLSENFSHSSWTRKEIAEWAGTTTETVIRSLAQFEKDGLISQNYKNFSILDKNKLLQKINEK